MEKGSKDYKYLTENEVEQMRKEGKTESEIKTINDAIENQVKLLEEKRKAEKELEF